MRSFLLRFLPNWLKARYMELTNSIAFYPAFIALWLGALSIALLALRGYQPDTWLRNTLPELLQLDAAASRNLFGVIITASVSIVVFSFSMVMVVLGQAANNFTPRILDDMVGDKRPQRALGIYIGTVVYCIPLLIMVSDRYPAPVLAVLIAIILAVINMFVFIFFIDFVSKSIKPAQVCNRIYQQAQIHLQRLNQPVEEASLSCQNPNRPEAAPHVVEAKISGYFQELRLDALLKICKEKKLIAEVVPRPADYLIAGADLLYLWGAKANEDLNELDSDIAKCFVFYSLENVESNSFYAYRQLTEVAVKALSPGINDMGTARIAIEFLADLMSRYPQQEVYRCVNDSDGDLRIILNPLELHHLFEFCFDPIRIYARNDKMVLYTFLKVCKMMLEMHGENSVMLQEVKLFTEKIMDDLEAKRYLQDTGMLLRFYNIHLKPALAAADEG